MGVAVDQTDLRATGVAFHTGFHTDLKATAEAFRTDWKVLVGVVLQMSTEQTAVAGIRHMTEGAVPISVLVLLHTLTLEQELVDTHRNKKGEAEVVPMEQVLEPN